MTEAPAAPRLIFRAGENRYALPAAAVREVARVPRLTPVPLAPPALLGLGAVRGETLAVLCPEALAGRDPRVAPRQLLVLGGARRAAIAIDRIERVAIAPAEGTEEAIDFELDEWIAGAFPIREMAARLTKRHAEEQASEEEDQLGLLCFELGDQSFALPLEDIDQVLRSPGAIARLPGADKAVVGTIDHPDGPLGILSLAALLDLPKREQAGPVVVARIGRHRVGLVVDSIAGVLHMAASQIDPVPATLRRGNGEARISAICRAAKGSRLVSVLAANQLLSEERTSRLLGTKADPVPVASTVAGDGMALVPVTLGKRTLAFPLTAIAGVAGRPAACTPVPGSPNWLIGIAMVRGEPIPIVDQVQRLTGRAAAGLRQRLIIVDANGARVGFLVDGVGAIIRTDRGALEPSPLPEDLASGVYGDVLRLGPEEDALLVLEPFALISSAEQELVAKLALPLAAEVR